MIVILPFQRWSLILASLVWLVNGYPNLLGGDGFGQRIGFDSPDSTYIESLQNAGLYDIAIETCRSRQKMSGLSNPEAKAQWSMLLMKSMVAKLANDPKTLEQPDLLTAGFNEVQSFATELNELPRQPWIALCVERCRWYMLQRTLSAYLAVPARRPLREWSLESIRIGLDKLEKLQIQFKAGQSRAPGPNSGPTTASSSAEWISLANDASLLQADLLLLRATFYPPRSTERIAAATEMLTSIDNAQRSISGSWSGRPMLELARCRALLLLDRAEEAIAELTNMKRTLEQPSENNNKPDFRWTQHIAVIAAESNRHLNRIEEANRWIEQAGGWSKSPEMAMEHFANLVSRTASSNTTHIDEVLQLKNEIGKRFGFHWQQRADAVLVNSSIVSNFAAPSRSEGEKKIKLELLMSEAKQFLAAKRIQEAIDKLRQAEMSAANSDDIASALDVAIRVASIFAANGQPEIAQSEFHRAALQYAKTTKAPDAAMMSVWQTENTSIGVSDPAAIAVQFATLRQRLMDVVTTWPDSPQAIEACSRLDRMLLRADKLPDLAELWTLRLKQSVNENHVQLASKKTEVVDQSLTRFATIHLWLQDAWLDRSMSNSVQSSTKTALQQLEQELLESSSHATRATMHSTCNAIRDGGQWPNEETWPLMNELVEGASENYIKTSSLARIAGGVAIAAIDHQTSQDLTGEVACTWARANLIFHQLSQANRNDQQNSKRLLVELKSAMEVLSPIANARDGLLATRVGAERVELLSEHIKLWEIGFLCWSGRESTGLEMFKNSIPSQANNLRWSYRTARVFQSTSGQRPLALNQFRTLAKRFAAGSDGWLEMRARTYQTLLSMGNETEASTLSDLVNATYAAMTPEWKRRFGK